MWRCWFPGLCSSWPGSPLGARLLSQKKQALETHFGFETVSEEEKGRKGKKGREGEWRDLTVYDLVSSAQLRVDLMAR